MLSRGWDASDHLTEAAKRMSDVALAVALMVATAPLLFLLAVVVKLSGGGPAFYAQTRVGRYGRTFRMLKLRTMRVDAESGEARWAQGDDPRQTRVGRVLRRTRLDELPQLLNILVGEMSFVGPRPERPEFVALFERTLPRYGERHRVRPGITGLAQVRGLRGAHTSLPDRLALDLEYIAHWSLALDLRILARTAWDCLRLELPLVAPSGPHSQDHYRLVALAEAGDRVEERAVEPVRRGAPDVRLVEHEQHGALAPHRVDEIGVFARKREHDHRPAGVPAVLAAVDHEPVGRARVIPRER
jgi:lipopolysaccharide/colanic/teichoic acid biosynthesis glycosyltransferase